MTTANSISDSARQAGVLLDAWRAGDSVRLENKLRHAAMVCGIVRQVPEVEAERRELLESVVTRMRGFLKNGQPDTASSQELEVSIRLLHHLRNTPAIV